MTKTRKSEKSKKNLKAEATTHPKTLKGKVEKKRLNIKTIKSNDEVLKVGRSGEKNFASLQLFSGKLKRSLSNTHAQPKVSQSGQIFEATTQNDAKRNRLVINPKSKVSQKKTNISVVKQSNRNSSKTKKCLSTIVSDKSAMGITETKEMQNFYCNKQITPLKSRDRFQYRTDDQSTIKPKRCFIKLKKMSTTKKDTSTPLTIKKCFVKLTNIPNVVETNNNFETTLTCKEQNCMEIANLESVSSNFCINTTVIDENKRKNFRKLSLAKSIDIVKNSNRKETTEVSNALTKSSADKELNALTKNKQLAINQIASLSLKAPIQKLEENKANESVPFNPVRNSTLLDIDSTRAKERTSSNRETSRQALKDRSSFQNFANKSDEIENFLNSLEDEGEVNENNKERQPGETSQNISFNNNKTNKFFNHKKQEDTTKNFKENSKASEVIGSRQALKRRSTRANRDNVYEFLSQSQTSDSDSAKHADPAADIVRKLITEGKVQVATNCKGKGKPKFKPSVRPKNKIKPTAFKKLNQLKNTRRIKKVTFVENGNAGVVEDQFDNDHFDNDYLDNHHLNNDEQIVNFGHDMENETRNIGSSSNLHNNENVVHEQEGTFSSLARTVLIKEANSKRQKQSELLEKVRNIISTPKNKKTALHHADLQTDFSPIAMPPSPWRVNEEAYLPKLFNFSRSSGNLPSFSSDFIPSTPRKEKLKFLNDSNPTAITRETPRTKRTTDTSAVLSCLTNTAENVQHQLSNLSEPSKISSFSSNDSNAENMPPSKLTCNIQNENVRIFDSKEHPNPRRALKNRSPLKAINILDIVHLPNLKLLNKPASTDAMGVQQEEMFGFEENLDESNQLDRSNESISTQRQNDNSKNVINYTEENLFGFEEYLSQSVNSTQESYKFDNNETDNNQSIQVKLHSLRKFKPTASDLQNNLKQNSKYKMKEVPIFVDGAPQEFGRKQKSIKEMLCSTMLDVQPSTSKEALNRLNKDRLKTAKQQIFGQEENLSELFTDPDPETTFNESEAHRTYIRPQKRKRRLKEDNFVMLLESDESGEDDDGSAEKKKLQVSSESDKGMEKVSNKKRQRKSSKDDIALMEFVKEFNELCKEVESHELVVERSA